MSANNTSHYGAVVSVAVNAYPAATAPTVNVTKISGGRWSIYNSSSTLDCYVSFDGAEDCAVIPPGGAWTDPCTGSPGVLWIKMSAATATNIYCNLVASANCR